MSKIWVYSGDRPSNGAKALAEVPGFLRLRPDRMFKVKPNDLVVNWGVSNPDIFHPQSISSDQILNAPGCVAQATNKLAAFKLFADADVSVVPFTPAKDVALGWLLNDRTVVVRNKLTGHSGDGIVIIGPGQELPDAPLYTQYVFKEKEYRVHVVNGKVIDTQRKIKDPEREVITWKVRSHANGFMYVRGNILPCDVRDALAIKAIEASALDFGAVDIIVDKHGTHFVLEVNTAPGLEGQTILNYAEAFLNGTQGAD